MSSLRLSGRPILGTRVDRDLFVGRDGELSTARRALADGLNCVIVGDPGAGRTSLLHRLLESLDKPAILVRGVAQQSATALLRAVIKGITDRTSDDDNAPEKPYLAMTLTDPADLIEYLHSLVDPAAQLVVAIDDVAPTAGLELFGQHRDDLWAVPIRWVGTLSTSGAAVLLRPPVDVFFDVRIDLPPLSAGQSAELISLRVPDGSALPDAVITASGGNPRRLIALTRELLAAKASQSPIASTAVERAARIGQLPAPARMLARELEALGGASASDPALLAKLNWTRSRTVQVLKQLESAGIVVASDVKDGPGRPRRVYRLT